MAVFEKTKKFLQRVLFGATLISKLDSRHLLLLFKNLNKTKIRLLITFGILLLVSSGFLIWSQTQNPQNKKFGGEHVEGLIGQPRFINPVLAASSSVDMDLSRIVFAQLLRFDENLKLVADLALDLPQISADQRNFTFKLKPNLKWQDGQPITADDIIFTIQIIQNPDIESPLRPNWNHVKVDRVDDLTVVFRLREVSSSFITNFTLGILPKHVWQGLPSNNFRLADLNLKPVGSGPFEVLEIKKTAGGTIKSIALKPNPNYYLGRPFLNQLTFKFYPDYETLLSAYQSKDIQSLGFVPFDKKAFLEENSRATQYQISLPQYQAVFFNLTKSSIAADKAVRQALWLTTDRQTVVDQVYLGLAQIAVSPIVKGNLGYNPDIETITHNSLDEANDILNRGGWIMNEASKTRFKNKKPLEFNLVTNNFVLNVKTAQILQTQWQALGANVHLTIVSSTDLEEQYLRPRNFDLLLFSENTGADPDPFAFWHSSQTRDPGLNISGFTNAKVDQLLTQARQTNDVNIRTKNYQQFQLIVTQELPAIFLDSAVYVYNLPQKLKGFNLTTIINPSERFSDIAKWYFEK